ncbi:hypothetical protein KRX57_10835 [Weeksellaceae bacterium TAE3-ERU29]|nr:hypothetical protein [Weeksellaceae bacterium TAE3-ERU29]
MKRILLLFTFSLLGIYGFSQSKKNDLKLSVSALPLFGASQNFESGINGLVIKSSVGYYISDKTSIDLNFAYTSMNNIIIDDIDSYYNSFAFIPTLRNNFVNLNNLRVFAEFGVGLGTIRYNANNDNYRGYFHEQLSGGISIINLGVGGNYYFNDKFGLELVIPYIITNNITSGQSKHIYSGVGPTIGLTYKIN